MGVTAATSGFVVLFLSVSVVQSSSRLTYISAHICAVRGSTVDIRCACRRPSTVRRSSVPVEKILWFTDMQDEGPVDLSTDSEYAGRVKYYCDKTTCTLRITDLRESDSAEYKFKFKDKPSRRFTRSPGVTLSVTDPDVQVQVSRSFSPWAELQCHSTCHLPDRPSYLWYKNGQNLQEETSSSYSDYVDAADSFSCAVKGHEGFPAPSVCVYGQSCHRVTYTDRSICAPSGSSVDISCTYYSVGSVTSKFWFSPERSHQWGDPNKPQDLSEDSQYTGRVQVLPAERGRSTLRISDLRATDSAQYHFRYKTRGFEWRSSLPGTTLTVTDADVQVQVQVSRSFSPWAELQCHSTCHLPDRPSYLWYKNGQNLQEETSSSYSDYVDAADSFSCAVKGHEGFPAPSVCVYGQSCHRVTYTDRSICAPSGSSVDISCTYYSVGSVTSKFWFSPERSHQWGDPNKPQDLSEDSQYTGRVQVLPAERGRSTLRISDLRATDSAQYHFRYKTRGFEWRSSLPGTTLTVTDADVQVQVQVSRSFSPWAELQCHSTCHLPDRPSYLWYKNGQNLQEETSSSYSDYVDAADSFSCAVKGHEGFPAPSVCVYGQSCHRVTYTDRSICAPSGSSVDISCTYYSVGSVTSKFWFSPERSHQWGDPNKPQDLSEDSQYTGRVQVLPAERGRSTLRISDLRATDSAQYHFRYKTRGFEWRSSLPGTTLTVTDADVQVQVIWSPSGPKLLCHSSCLLTGRSSFVWYKNETMIQEETSASYGQDVHAADSYSCAYQSYRSAAVYAPRLPSVSLSPSGDIMKNDSVTLSCSSDANPAAKYTWYKGEQLFIEKQQLVFSSIQSSHSDQYYCEAENELGRRTSQYVFINVKYGPKLPSVSVSPSAEIEEGSSVTLSCSSDANPAATYTWYKGKQQLLQGTEGSYHFTSISSEDRGIYYCKSENQHGHIMSSSLSVDVQYGPKLPSVSVSPSAEIEEGSSVTLSCSSDANPAANYTWYKEDGNLKPLSEDPQLVFSSLRSSDSGQYQCRAQNKLGMKTSKSISIDVKYGPKLPSVSVSPSAEIEEGRSVTLSCSSDANPAANVYLIPLEVAAFIVRRRRTSKQTTEPGERPDNRAQINSVSDSPSAAAQKTPAEQEQELCYATVNFSKNQEDPLYSNIRLHRHQEDPLYSNIRLHRHQEEEDVDYTTVQYSQYAGRVQYHCDSNNICTLRITDVRESDSADYKFSFITNHPGGRFTGSPGVTLSVKGFQVQERITSSCNVENCKYGTLKCLSSCRPTRHPSYIWYRNGQIINGKHEYIYPYTYFYPEDSYSCAAQGYEESAAPSVCVYGQSCHRVTYTDRSICAPSGSSVDISCTYYSVGSVTSKFWFSPERSHQWGDPNKPQDLSEDSQYTGRVQVLPAERGRSTLRISDLRATDSAQYHFRYKTRGFEWRSSLPGTTLTVTDADVQVQVIWSPSGPKLLCHSSCLLTGRSSFVWYKNETMIQEETSASYGQDVHAADSYSCAYQSYRSAAVYAPRLPSVSLSPSGDIMKNDSVTLSCSSDANPAAKYTWYKGEQLFIEKQQLIFSSIQSSHSDQYYCEAENELGRRTSQYVFINVKYGPKLPSVSVSPSAEIEEGSSVTLSCSSDANPAANYTWYKGKQTLLQGTEGSYHFTSISSEDRGIYYCKSENQHGHIMSSSLSVDVQYGPKLPSVSVSPSAEIEEGSSVTLSCSSDANPAANYTWYKEDEDSPKESGQNFTITDFRSEHSGNYCCVAQNSRGRRDSTLQLTVGAGAWTSAATGSITAVLLAFTFLAVVLWIRRRKSITQQSAKRPDTREQLNLDQVQDDLHYSSIRFPQNQEEALYSNVGAAQTRRQSEDEEVEVVYTAVQTNSGRNAPGRQGGGEDVSAVYSTVNK
ncbi:titin-like [Cottoperca gobio]|uniref:B-cell receptor CD22 n=1 Tax=Cottoperca gobio TaxID=56716 RepID=A0A6J2PD26_COTGO|nr:titin-like [Cottoperca gobio]